MKQYEIFMKKLTVLVFENEKKYNLLSNRVCQKFSKSDENKEFCGLWGEIQNNANEVIMSISATINHFIDSNKQEIIFGCCEKDYGKIIEKIDLSSCIVDKVDAQSILK